MITAVDTNILLDVFLPDPVFGSSSWEALMTADDKGGLVICGPVYAELAAFFPDRAKLDAALDNLDIKVTPVPRAAAFQAGQAWKQYRKSGGSRRDRIMTDFLIGAHALVIADQFLTRDRGYQKHFATLVINDPSPDLI